MARRADAGARSTSDRRSTVRSGEFRGLIRGDNRPRFEPFRFSRHRHPAVYPLTAEPGYTEHGLPTREAFATAVAEHLPSFYSCRKFVFQFDRHQIWPITDSFSVTVDPQGRIESVSELKEDEFGE